MTNEELAEVDELVGRLQEQRPEGEPISVARLMDAAADTIQSLETQLAEARAENERLREALRVYAGPMEWTQEGGWGAFPVWADGYPGGVYVDDNTLDYGDAARAALKENPNAG